MNEVPVNPVGESRAVLDLVARKRHGILRMREHHMTRQEVLDKLAAHCDELRRMGVKSLALFGSLARGEATDTSDVDLLVEFDRPIGYFHFFDVQEYLQRILGVPNVDLVSRNAVIEELKEVIYGEAVDAF